MAEFKARDQMPTSVVAVIAAVGEMIDIKKQFDAGNLTVDKLADALWEKLVALEGKHAAMTAETQPKP